MQANNVVSILGNLGADPEKKETQNGAMTKFRVAVKRIGKDAETDWVPVTIFGRQAEVAAEYLKKGKQVMVVGSLRVETYEKNGEKKTYSYILADNFQMLSSKEEGSVSREDNWGSSEDKKAKAPPKKKPADEEELEDDIPPF